MLIDTDVLIWLFRGQPSARKALEKADRIQLSTITYMELVHGMQLADALIAASAVESGAALMTANTKHYKVIPEIDLKMYRP